MPAATLNPKPDMPRHDERDNDRDKAGDEQQRDEGADHPCHPGVKHQIVGPE